jgi:hypothetical protein
LSEKGLKRTAGKRAARAANSYFIDRPENHCGAHSASQSSFTVSAEQPCRNEKTTTLE